MHTVYSRDDGRIHVHIYLNLNEPGQVLPPPPSPYLGKKLRNAEFLARKQKKYFHLTNSVRVFFETNQNDLFSCLTHTGTPLRCVQRLCLDWF